MEDTRYCGDCQWYVPDGKDPNCSNPTKVGKGRYTCPLREACKLFEPRGRWEVKNEENDLIRRNKCRRVGKTKKRHK